MTRSRSLATRSELVTGSTYRSGPDTAEDCRKRRRGFYDGPVADAIVNHVRQHGGILSTADLAGYRPKIMMEKPLRYGAVDYITANDQVGYECLNILDQFPLVEFGPDSIAYRHLMAESLGAAFADNMYWYGDPDVVESPVTGLASPAFGRARASIAESGGGSSGVQSKPADPRRYQDDAIRSGFAPKVPRSEELAVHHKWPRWIRKAMWQHFAQVCPAPSVRWYWFREQA